MIRAGIYARFSTDSQNPRSSADQIALGRVDCAAHDWTVVAIFRDDAVSGGSIFGRPDFARMIAMAERGELDLLWAEDIERFSRNLADVEQFRERMEFAGVRLWTKADGEVGQLNAAFKGLSSAMMLKGHAQRTRDRQGERVREGLSGGGLTYGYAPGPRKGTRIIVEHEARVVRQIFADYDRGLSPRAIAAALNGKGVKPPRGGDWRASTLIGNPKRGSGILANTLYDGRLIWNRVTMRKDPRNGKRVSRINPPSAWIERAVPDLRIVDAELFARVQAQRLARAKERPEQARRPRHLLAGLLRCGCCGGAMAVNNVDRGDRRIGCGRRKEGGSCANAKTYALAPIETRVVSALRAQLADPRAIERYLKTYQAERKRLAAGSAAKRAAAERDLAQTLRAIERVVGAIAQGTILDGEARVQLTPLRARREALEVDLLSLAPPEKIVALHPAAIATYLAAVDDLAAALARRVVEGDDELAQALATLVAAVKVTPGHGNMPSIEVTGRLAAIAGGEIFPQGRLSPPALVAGARYRRSRCPESAVFAFAA